MKVNFLFLAPRLFFLFFPLLFLFTAPYAPVEIHAGVTGRHGWVIRAEWHARPSSWMGFRDRLSKPNDRLALDNLNRENFCSFQKHCPADAGINMSVRGLASMLSACQGKEKHYEIHAAWCTVICNRGPSSNRVPPFLAFLYRAIVVTPPRWINPLFTRIRAVV